MFDTEFVIALSRDNPKAKAAYLKHANERILISSFTWYELMSGICKTSSPGKELRKVHDCITAVGIIHFDDTVAALAGKYAALQAEKGKPIGIIDNFIAATCVINGETIVSNDNHFKSIPGLKVESW